MIDKTLKESLLHQFRTDPTGIRLNVEMSRICLNCGSDNVTSISKQQHYDRHCKDCMTHFYRHRCWKCKKTVDSRDIATPPCYKCGFCICTCGACSPFGCKRYQEAVLDFDPDDLLPSKTLSDNCSECGGDGYAQDGGQCEYCHGSGDFEDFAYYDEDGEFDQDAYNKAFKAPPPDYSVPTNTGERAKI